MNRSKMSFSNVLIGMICLCVSSKNAQLIVNVKDKGGNILQETISANTSTDTVTLQFMKFDGTLITQFIDFPNEIQIFKSVVLGETERGKFGYQVMCFITRFIKNEFISSDAMSKLRQKKPGAVRNPEEDKGEETFQLDLMVDIEHAAIISPHVAQVCKEAKDATYARDNDLKVLSRMLDKDYATLIGATKRIPLYRMQRCPELEEMWRPCTCHYHSCIGWYPCGLKYCKGKDSSGKVVSYRCGIKTCRKCRLFEYYARQKQLCIWDENYNLQAFDVTKNTEKMMMAEEEEADDEDKGDSEHNDENEEREQELRNVNPNMADNPHDL